VSDKLSEVQARIASVHELEAVVGAMRGIAAARSREARGRLAGIQACADIIGAAIGGALMLDKTPSSSDRDTRHEQHLLIIFCAEQGFVGSFNDHVINTALQAALKSMDVLATKYCVIGGRGIVAAQEHNMTIEWSTPMVAHADEAAALADRITQMLYRYIESGSTTRVSMLHAVPDHSTGIEIVERQLLPFDFKRFSASEPRCAPLVTLSPSRLLGKLAEEYIFAQLCEAIMLSFAAENEARMRAMIAARTNVHTTLTQLIGSFCRLRQEEITSEIIELSAGSLAADMAPRKPHRAP